MDSRRKALPQKELLLPLIQGIQDHIHRETLSRFHATKKLEEGMEGETVRLFMDVAFRAPGGQCSLREAVPAPGKRGSPGRGHPVSAGVAATPSCSAAAHGSFLGPLVLTNPSNYCYLNSAIRALLWSLSAADRHYTEAQASSGHWGLTSAGLQAYRFSPQPSS